ncbi:site-specific integrase [Streptomyces sp. NPDC057908]|uniref:site-specific integrase n=1 Tax=Streptomyces sp. NPDC057908 TaxID=3346276 RepID=UPI0036E7B6E0
MLGVRDLPAALDAVGLRPGDPVFVRPDFVVDAELLQFALSPEFRDLERESRRNYATDIRLLLSWLWQRGVPWRSATGANLRAYKEFRVDSPMNPQRVGGTKWNREAAALTRLYKWAKVSPLPLDVGRRGDRAASARSSRVSWEIT